MKRVSKARQEYVETCGKVKMLEYEIQRKKSEIKQYEKTPDNSVNLKPYLGSFGWAFLGAFGFTIILACNDISVTYGTLFGAYAVALPVCLFAKQMKLNDSKKVPVVKKRIDEIADIIIEEDSKIKELEKTKALMEKQKKLADQIDEEIALKYTLIGNLISNYQSNPTTFIKNEIEQEKINLNILYITTLKSIEAEKKYRVNDLQNKNETYNYKNEYDLDSMQAFSVNDQMDSDILNSTKDPYSIQRILKR